MGQNQVILRHRIIHFPTSLGVNEWAIKRARKQMNSTGRLSEASRAEQANEWVVRTNKQTNERVAQYLCPNFWLFWTTVDGHRPCIGIAMHIDCHSLTHIRIPLLNAMRKSPPPKKKEMERNLNWGGGNLGERKKKKVNEKKRVFHGGIKETKAGCFLLCYRRKIGWQRDFPFTKTTPPLSRIFPLPLWSRTAKNTDWSTGPLARPFAQSLAPLTRSLAPDCSLCLRPPLRSLVRLLAHFAQSLACGTVND